jgi:Flp pilus assembly protein TadD
MSSPIDALRRAAEHQQAGRLDAAEQLYREVLRANPGHVEATSALGVIAVMRGRLDEAIELLAEAARREPTLAIRHAILAEAYRRKGLLAEAYASANRALELNPRQVEAHQNLGWIALSTGHIEAAIERFSAVLQLQPGPAAHNYLGMLYQGNGRWSESEAHLREALRLAPDFASAHYNLGVTLLATGRFADGWDECEWRWRASDSPPAPLAEPAWDGSPLAGRTLLVRAEQGLGDIVQFIRYVPIVERQAEQVFVECRPELVPLLLQSGFSRVLARGGTLPRFDVHAMLMSLPRLLGTRLDSIPAKVPYLTADPAAIEHWRSKLAPLKGLRVGIHWQGNRQYLFDAMRSIRLAEFAPLAAVESVRLISLQQGRGTEQLADARSRFTVHELGPDVDASGAFLDTVAVIKNLDLVITSDTSLAHVAGALGAPVWLAVSTAPDWRWLLDRADSPWYPSMRLFRQSQPRQWSDVFAAMARELAQRVAGGGGRPTASR